MKAPSSILVILDKPKHEQAALAEARRLMKARPETHLRLVSFVWLAMAGCFLHAKYDFPFQVYSLHFVFLLLCCVCSCLSRK